MVKKLILCDCLGSQTIDAGAIERGAGLGCSKIHTGLCLHQAETAAKAMAGGDVAIACMQERERFEELAAEIGAETPQFVDIRDRAGWSDEAAEAGPKMAALVADALLPEPDTKLMEVASEGLCLILGAADVALSAAERLSEALAVTVLLDTPAELPVSRAFDVTVGRLVSATGSLGDFSLRIDALQLLQPGGRGAFGLTEPRDGGKSVCDVILDLRRAPPLFPAHRKRDGYFRADPGDPNAVAAAVFEAGQAVGTFEKPLYVALEPQLCAHSRAGQTGCTKCLDACPTGAISPAGDHVAVDPNICAGCGACSALCPSGAISFDAPPVRHVFRRIEAMATAYRKAGGTAPRMLVTDAGFGSEMISLAARFGRGLPADVVPLEMATLAGFGHAEMLAALACGFAAVDILPAPETERDVLAREQALAEALSGGRPIRVLDADDPDGLSEMLYSERPEAQPLEPVLPMGSRRQVARLAAKALNPADTVLDLPAGAPYGAVLVDTEACTLCLSCAGLCPSGALGDNPDSPQLRFQEDACLQCGLCANICPEDAITLRPQMDLGDGVMAQRVLHEEEPYECIECGKPFGVKSTVERIVAKLGGSHYMYDSEDKTRMIRMCDDCRVQAQYHSADNPFQGGERPRPRTTEDYYSKRKDH
ncbi:(4Fe-4S)-binding protein [Maritimibacter sp. 55A14]|uniref:4Fe-4S binding protein n=1 Tax=Maritimibacter sp. 55A14 TaxID=2174844 RepID=UPI000D60DB82|nr:4Fe-4S binding protein [Maritimibacter sp. 55A14]PWE32575.1 (4Fe-4S)-binding protein [Maritimibacter sp. 55A14]